MEPSADMLLEVEKLEGVKPYHASADDFFASDLPSSYNKILMCQSVHLLPDSLATFEKAAQCLPAGATMAIITRSKGTAFPLWKTIRDRFAFPEVDDILKVNLQKAGFRVQIHSHVYSVKMTKGEWYYKVRQRMFSVLQDQTDGQIEAGLKEVDREFFPGVENTDTVEVRDSVILYIATLCTKC